MIKNLLVLLVLLGTSTAQAQTFAKWNASDKHGNIFISGGGYTLTSSGSGWSTARADQSKTAGKWYYENKMVDGGAYVLCGVATASSPLNDSIGHTSGGWGYRTDGLLVANGSGTAAPSYTAGDTCMIAYDADADKLWFGKNGTWLGSGNPATGANATYTGVSGAIYPASSFYNSSGAAGITANFGQVPFTYTVPSGFESGWCTPDCVAPAQAKDISVLFAFQAFGVSVWLLLGATLGLFFIQGLRVYWSKAI